MGCADFHSQPRFFCLLGVASDHLRDSGHTRTVQRSGNAVIPFVALRGQRSLFSSSHRLSSSSSMSRVCNLVSTNNLRVHHAIQPWGRLPTFTRSAIWFIASLAAGSNSQIRAVWPNHSLNRTHCGGPPFGLKEPSPNASPPQRAG